MDCDHKILECPYCHSRMEYGHIFAPDGYMTYWLKDQLPLTKWIVRKSVIEEVGGVVLGMASKIFFLAKKRADSYHCRKCQVIITKYHQNK